MLEFTTIGTYWPANGDLFYLTDSANDQARVYVDSVGETWVEITRIPQGGYFHSERVTAYRAHKGAAHAVNALREVGFTALRSAPYAHRVEERLH